VKFCKFLLSYVCTFCLQTGMEHTAYPKHVEKLSVFHYEWLHSQVVKRQTRDGEVMGSNLTHCAVEYSPGQAGHAHLPLSPCSIIWY